MSNAKAYIQYTELEHTFLLFTKWAHRSCLCLQPKTIISSRCSHKLYSKWYLFLSHSWIIIKFYDVLCVPSYLWILHVGEYYLHLSDYIRNFAGSNLTFEEMFSKIIFSMKIFGEFFFLLCVLPDSLGIRLRCWGELCAYIWLVSFLFLSSRSSSIVFTWIFFS